MTDEDFQKLTLFMLCDIMKGLEIRSDVDPDFVLSAITGGNLWGLKAKYPGIFEMPEPTEEVISATGKYLDMWYFLEESYEQISPEDHERIEKEAAPFGTRVAFRGFDGNNETDYYGVALFLTRELNRFDRFSNRDLNSHMPSVDTYARMYDVFRPIQLSLEGRLMTADEIIEVLKARQHPDA